MTKTPTTRTQADRSAETRARILDAAVAEFASYGLAGARTDRIAQAAGVNKALLYYYFDSKDNLYLAAFEMVAAKMRDDAMAVFFQAATPGERILRTAIHHFDRILSQTAFQTMMQQEMMRVQKGESNAMPILMQRVFTPMLTMYQAMVREGIASSELVETEWINIHLATLGINVFYFMGAHIWRHILPDDPLAPEVLVQRRAGIIRFLGKTIFNDRTHGAELAERVLADTPMPTPGNVGIFRRLNERA